MPSYKDLVTALPYGQWSAELMASWFVVASVRTLASRRTMRKMRIPGIKGGRLMQTLE